MISSCSTGRRLNAVFVGSLLTLAACTGTAGDAAEADTDTAAASTGETEPTASGTDYLASYALTDEDFGTMVTVTVDDSTRTIVANALPDHDTGDFPNSGNPNTITEQDLIWEFPIEPTLTTEAQAVRTSGVALNGVKFEPGTAETLSCTSGETFRIEALQDVYDLGLDFNNAHVQPTGEYHYHGISQLLVDGYDNDGDLVLIGFAPDGHLIYYSKSDAYASSYVLSSEPRTGTECVVSGPSGETVDVDGSMPDGTYSSDWVFDETTGDLDECNGTTVDGEYLYLATDAYPYISRCVMGDVSSVAGVGGGPGGPPPRGNG